MRRAYDEHELAVAFFHGWISKSIEEFAQRIGLSPSELTGRLAELLSTETRGEELGSVNRVPGVQAETPKADQNVEPVAVAHRSSGNRTQEAVPGTAAVKRPNPWATFTTPEARAKEMKRRMSLWPLDAKLRWMRKGRV